MCGNHFLIQESVNKLLSFKLLISLISFKCFWIYKKNHFSSNNTLRVARHWLGRFFPSFQVCDKHKRLSRLEINNSTGSNQFTLLGHLVRCKPINSRLKVKSCCFGEQFKIIIPAYYGPNSEGTSIDHRACSRRIGNFTLISMISLGFVTMFSFTEVSNPG